MLSSLKILIDSIYFLLPSIANVSALSLLLVFIYAILGRNLFAYNKLGEPLATDYPNYLKHINHPNENFQSFGSSIILLIALFTG